MENGQIAMQGSHEQLLAREERYRRLVELDRPGWADWQKPGSRCRPQLPGKCGWFRGLRAEIMLIV